MFEESLKNEIFPFIRNDMMDVDWAKMLSIFAKNP
jgi:hypothetical protein